MDEKLQAELEETLRGAEVRLMAQMISRDIDMVLTVSMTDTPALKARLLAEVIGQPPNYVTAVVVSAIRKTRGLIQGFFSQPLDFELFDLEHDDDEAFGFKWAHALVKELLTCSDDERDAISDRTQRAYTEAEEVTRGELLLHTFSICGSLLTHVISVREWQLQQEIQRAEENGSDS